VSVGFDPASLLGTLRGLGVIPPDQAIEEEFAARTQQAAQEAAQAAGQYQQAAQAPPPDLSPLAAFVPSLLSNFASVIGGTPSYRENRQADLQQQRRGLLESRAQNLQRLRDLSLQKAEAAEKIGDMEMAQKERLRAETQAKTWDLLMQQLRQHGAMELEKERSKNDLATAKVRASNAPGAGMDPDELDAIVESVVNGETEITSYPIRIRGTITQKVRDSGRKIMPKKVRDTVNTISSARGVVDQLESLSAGINTAGPGVARVVGGIKRSAEGAIQTRPDVTVFNAARDGFLATISRSTGERGVLTDRDVLRARSLLPNVWDSEKVANRKVKELRTFLDGLEQRAIKNFTTPNVGGQTQLADPAGLR